MHVNAINDPLYIPISKLKTLLRAPCGACATAQHAATHQAQGWAHSGAQRDG